jgi:nitrate/TMAO reductase-like tetraheme cytochrome c subunit
MEDNQSLRPPARDVSHEPEDVAPWLPLERGSPWRNLRWLVSRGVALAGGFLMMGLVLTGVAGWYTSRPQFCRSCHNMEPYYVSWHKSTHKDVSCIKCHFPPGAGEKIRGKMLGLVQLAKYVTRSEGPRPAAEIPDESCLRSGCHETRLLTGRIAFQGIPFDHRPHLEEERRGKKLRCTSCHSQIVQGAHMTVTPSTCFLCHFRDGHFNEGLGACTRCHQIPEQDFDLGGSTKFNHELAYEKGVDCANCHGDLIGGNGEVPRERCGVCHNREDDLRRISDHVFMHEKHVTDHNVDCLACHLEIQHSLDPHRIETAAANCTSCHPAHHLEQVSMLKGQGGKTIVAHDQGMSTVRIACPSCHRFREVSATGTVLWKASTESCLMCHDRDMTDELQAYHAALRASLDEIDAALSRVREALPAAEVSPQRAAALPALVDDLQHDLSFLRVANGIHNIHYATTLTRTLVDRLKEVCRELQVEEPAIALPESIKLEAGKPQPAEPKPAPPEPTEPQPGAAEPPTPEAEKPAAEPATPGPEPAKAEPSESEAEKPEMAAPEAKEPEPEPPKPESGEPKPPEPDATPPEPEAPKPETKSEPNEPETAKPES